MRRTSLAVAAALLLASCGGGGGGAELRVETNYDAAGAWRNLLSAPHAYAATGRGSDGRDYSYSLQFTPRGAANYPRTGASATRVDRQGTLQAPGLAPAVDPGALFFIGSFLLIGLTSGTGCSDVSMPFGLPGPVPIGSGASMFSASGYPGCGASSDGSGATTRSSIQYTLVIPSQNFSLVARGG